MCKRSVCVLFLTYQLRRVVGLEDDSTPLSKLAPSHLFCHLILKTKEKRRGGVREGGMEGGEEGEGERNTISISIASSTINSNGIPSSSLASIFR